MKKITKKTTGVLLVCCMAVIMLFSNIPQAQAASKNAVTKTFKIPAYTQFCIYYEVSPSANVKAVITSLAKNKEDRMAVAALGSGNGEKYITADKKKISLKAYTGDDTAEVQKEEEADIICLYLTNGSDKAVKYKVKLSGPKKITVKYLHADNNGEGAG